MDTLTLRDRLRINLENIDKHLVRKDASKKFCDPVLVHTMTQIIMATSFYQMIQITDRAVEIGRELNTLTNMVN